jgi:hypothetical protein
MSFSSNLSSRHVREVAGNYKSLIFQDDPALLLLNCSQATHRPHQQISSSDSCASKGKLKTTTSPIDGGEKTIR